MENCPKCHSEHRVKAEFANEGAPFGGIRFRPEDVITFSKRPKLQALACPSCGYVELSLVPERDPEQPPGLGTWVFA